MPDGPDGPGPAPGGPDEMLAAAGRMLAERVAAAVPGWCRDAVARMLDAWLAAGGVLGGDGDRAAVLDQAEAAGRDAGAAVATELSVLAAADVDSQRTTPLEVVRRLAVPAATAVLAAAGVPPVERDAFAEARLPGDRYALTPASLAALGDEIGELGLAWGAAKALAHRARHGGGPRSG